MLTSNWPITMCLSTETKQVSNSAKTAKPKRDTCIQTSTLWVVLLRNYVEIKCFLVAILLSLKCFISLISFRGNKLGQKAVDHAAERNG